MATVNMIRCEHCKAIMNPNWTACLVCGAESERDPRAVLAALYLRYWTTPETDPLETFQAIFAEITALETRLDPGKVIGILEAEAQKYHHATGRCPYCQLAGPLHQEPTGHDGGRR